MHVSHLEFQDGRQQKSLFCPYIFDLIHAKYDFISLFVLRNAIFISEFIIWEYRCLLWMSILTMFIKVMRLMRLLCCVLENALMQKMTTAESLTSNI